MSFCMSAMSGRVYAHLCKVVIGHFGSCFGFLEEWKWVELE